MTDMETLKKQIKSCADQHKLAFVVGNGINRYVDSEAQSWSKLLLDLYSRSGGRLKLKDIPEGITETEFFDVLEFQTNRKILDSNETYTKILKEKVIQRLSTNISNNDNYERLRECFKSWNVPVLTTNFDCNLEVKGGYYTLKNDRRKFTDFYPWDVYFSDEQKGKVNPLSYFAIWHVNGMLKYKRSIRLGFSDYMNLVSYTKEYLREYNNIKDGNIESWRGSKTWLNIFLQSNLCIFGLSLDANETYLRWLLIQRHRFSVNRNKTYNDYYLCVKDDMKEAGKKMFLESIGFNVVVMDSYDQIYKDFFGFEKTS